MKKEEAHSLDKKTAFIIGVIMFLAGCDCIQIREIPYQLVRVLMRYATLR